MVGNDTIGRWCSGGSLQVCIPNEQCTPQQSYNDFTGLPEGACGDTEVCVSCGCFASCGCSTNDDCGPSLTDGSYCTICQVGQCVTNTANTDPVCSPGSGGGSCNFNGDCGPGEDSSCSDCVSGGGSCPAVSVRGPSDITIYQGEQGLLGINYDGGSCDLVQTSTSGCPPGASCNPTTFDTCSSDEGEVDAWVPVTTTSSSQVGDYNATVHVQSGSCGTNLSYVVKVRPSRKSVCDANWHDIPPAPVPYTANSNPLGIYRNSPDWIKVTYDGMALNGCSGLAPSVRGTWCNYPGGNALNDTCTWDPPVKMPYTLDPGEPFFACSSYPAVYGWTNPSPPYGASASVTDEANRVYEFRRVASGGGTTTMQYRCYPAPSLGVNPANFNFSAEAGGTNPSSQTLTISNTAIGSGQLNWSVSDNASWLTVSRAVVGQETSGTENGGGSSTPPLTVAINTSGLSAGTHNAIIAVTSNGGNINVPVTLTLLQPLNPPNISFDGSGCTAFNDPYIRLDYSAAMPPAVTRIDIYRSGTAGPIFTDTAPSNTNRTFTDSDVQNNANYVYSAVAASATQTSPPASTSSLTAPTCTPVISITPAITQVNSSSSFNIRDIKDGDRLRFRITFTNSGSYASSQINVTETLSSNLRYVGNSFRCQTGAMTCIPGAIGTPGANPLIFRTNSSLNSGASFYADFEANVNAGSAQLRELLTLRTQGTYLPGPGTFDVTYSLLASPPSLFRPDFIEVNP